ncbi:MULTISPECIES: DNA-directed RNA polymerase subunit beta' [Bacillota]|jgi:DNA-directed RNA polymerase subunit beta'|uniref:DNA-directed RNA polymerase subunit beta' n=1 Tax=Massilimicrobiota timonensis TaxID=1776392 RepID=A0ABT7UI91_9FIRM|nr:MULTISPECIES: DNA-directed RNA polymerase subunit beta' [Massilimicrobiota]MDM8195240.1 DNA-directed RNA polymerase subunit beta' [Massilimicrobiota timonensis]MEE0779125.1 DNA-directed RNA polymerase subunit beta' [Massilimicrobiota sp.]OUN33540.1 DNA-directed RNA polymerase subunit beta' [Massilimicrobiota sp. An80]OUQ84863.1 DNA-directed RNA polymerase subunit beta' [Massilimicrobiota sp. An105]
MADVNNFSAIQIGLASPEKIREWSYGEVKKPETINYRSQKPEKDGLFCERIFGPSKDWECSCGKYKKVRYKGVICDRCGVEVTKSSVRRERMGHIELATPVAHIWYLKGIPSRMGLILDMSPKQLEEIIYFVSYVVTDKGSTPLEYKQVLSERDYRNCYEKFGHQFEAKTGAEAIKILLQKVDLDEEFESVTKDLKEAQGQRRSKLLKRLEAIEAFRTSHNQPEWMILDVLPVIPPDLRPMLQLDGGRFATSDLNDLYRRVITRNNRLKKLLELGTPSIIVQNEKRMLQEAVDALIDNGRRSKPITGAGGRPLKSLSHTLKGKQGRFRQNLLGKRVDYSGRSVIAVGPDLKMYQCGIPREMALNLFKPFVISGLVREQIATNIKAAERLIDKMDDVIWPIVEEVIKEHPVLLNRAPTLHRLGIQAFEPKLVEGRAIRLHPLVCPAFNADFDGDQMAVHVPLGEEAIQEARQLMLGSHNILGPKDGKPIVTPSQDMVLGNYYLTLEDEGAVGEGTVFADVNEVLMAYDAKTVHLHTRIAIRGKSLKNKTFTEKQNNSYLITSVGKIIFNQIFDGAFPFINDSSKENLVATPDKYFVPMGTDIKAHIKAQPLIKPLGKKALGNIINEMFDPTKISDTTAMLDKLKDQGFYYSTIAGITVSVYDIQVPQSKYVLFDEADEKLEVIKKLYRKGKITDEERHNIVIKLWESVKDQVQAVVKDEFEADDRNPIFIMSDSGARGNISNFTQLVGMRGLMSNPKGETIELPIKSSFREGLTASEFFISTHGARKGSTDTALKTADSGYLTRRLVDVAQEVIVTEDDCGTDQGFVVTELYNTSDNSVIVPLYDRLVGRYSQKDIVHPETGETLVKAGEMIDEAIAKNITDAGIKEVEIRSIFGCKAKNGICRKCYGRNLATGEQVELGEAIGIMAAQSIGEPGTQLTMRTFHMGGVAGGADITQGLPRIQELFEARNPKAKSIISEIDGEVSNIIDNNGRAEVVVSNLLETKSYLTPYGAKLRVSVGDEVGIGSKITEGSIDPKELLAVADVKAVENYILKEVQKVYRLQGIEISDKHIEVIIHQMLKKMRIVEGGDTGALPGTHINVQKFTELNKEALKAGKHPAVARPILLGITKASLETESFLSAASFQETTKILTDAAIKGKVDELRGLKENVIIGKLLPAGTGLRGPLKSPETIARELEEARKEKELEEAEHLQAETLSESLLSSTEIDEEFSTTE